MSAKQARAVRDGNGAAGVGREPLAALWMFDFDNTLAPLEPAVDWAASRRELQTWLAERGVARSLFEEIPRRNIVLYQALRERLSAGGASAREVLPGVEVDDAGVRTLLEGASAIIERYELAGVSAVAPAPGALELLEALRAADCTIAVVTSNSSRTVAAWLREHRGEAMVRVVVGRDSGLALKPSPATLARALEVCQIGPANAAFVGDSETDFSAAASLGIRFYGVNARAEGRQRLTALGAPEVFASPGELAIGLSLAAHKVRIGT